MREQMTVPAAPGDYLPELGSIRSNIGGWAQLSVVQYFVAESAVIEAWRGSTPYDRRTGFISDLGAIKCGIYEHRDVCSPLHVLMDASFVVQGLGMLLGALLLSSALLCIAARPGVRIKYGAAYRKTWTSAVVVRVLTGISGLGTVIVGFVPEDLGSPWHLTGALMFFVGGALALLVLGRLWLHHTAMSWFVLGCGTVSFGALVVGGLTRMTVPEPGTLERLMGYPITIGFCAAGLVVAQGVREGRRTAARLAGP
ncbi:membrane protein [Arthrobacter sp. MA-N2]|uniref:membrane protein n=1 Tax=Arthrobacter sp. MA-N2 TaxID=1101188 RepID=UPI0004850923|nr:membrane protein [Arthrobacter sp. MA-N2]